MSETRFMKGPWKAEKGRYGWQISTAWPGVELNHWIATIKCESCPAHEVDTAHLIAAAPAMYAALRLAAGHENAPDVLAAIDAALALARGEKNDG